MGGDRKSEESNPLSLKSDEAIRTDTAIAELANMGTCSPKRA